MADELRCYRAVDGARFTLVCFPHAGGNATAFRDWPAYLPEDVAVYAVRYPGRLDRSHEPPARAVGEITGPVARALGEVPGRLVLFGHSMGAVLAHQVAVDLEAAYRFPAALVVSGREAPHLTDRAPSPTTDEALLGMVRTMGGFPEDLLDDPEARDLVLSPLRADTALLNAYRGSPARPVRAPIFAYLGAADPGCSAAQIDGWRAVTTGAFRRRMLAGDHFTTVSRPAELLADLCGQV